MPSKGDSRRRSGTYPIDNLAGDIVEMSKCIFEST